MTLDEKPIDKLTPDDLDVLVSESICESYRLDYKREWWGDTDRGRSEMLRDISSFANANGGHIVVGISTNKEGGTGDLEYPQEIIGIPPDNYRERIMRSCHDNLDPVCTGIAVTQVPLNNGNICVVARVPQSLQAPHMVTFQGINQFWQRHGTDKQRMTTEEIRNLMFTRLTYEEKLLQTVHNRKETMRKKANDSPVLFLWASPIVPMTEEVNVNDVQIRDALGDALFSDPFRFGCQLYSGLPHPSLYGIEAALKQLNWLGFLRYGFLEFGTSGISNDQLSENPLISLRIALYLENFANLLLAICSLLQIQGPVALGCSLLSVKGRKLLLGADYLHRQSEATWDELDLDLGYEVTYDLSTERDGLLKHFNDMFWNAFHYENCPFYRSGQLELPR